MIAWSAPFATTQSLLVLITEGSYAPTVPARNRQHIMSTILAVALIVFSPASVLYYIVFKFFCYWLERKNGKYLLFLEIKEFYSLNCYFDLSRSAIEQWEGKTGSAG
jgi:hypothetical protein